MVNYINIVALLCIQPLIQWAYRLFMEVLQLCPSEWQWVFCVYAIITLLHILQDCYQCYRHQADMAEMESNNNNSTSTTTTTTVTRQPQQSCCHCGAPLSSA